ncbi:MAG: hypothetical protein QM530_09920 [Phycisphaerales bacterium]|nr:hypothetical protein [Phycisphaerales bacterium]
MVKIDRLLMLLYLGICSLTVQAQTEDLEQKVTPYGFVRSDIFYNSRKNLELRDGSLNLYPLDAGAAYLSNQSNADINKRSQVFLSGIVSRFGVKFNGLTAFGAKATGALETDFFGINTGSENLLRLRHAYVALDWTKTQLLVGQYWNPNFIVACYPGVANFSTGIPFNPFSFSPQVRITHKLNKKISAMGMIFGQELGGFSTAGTYTNISATASGSDAYRYANIPDIAAEITYTEGKKFIAGLGFEMNSIRPRINDVNPTTTYVENINKNVTMTNIKAYAKYTHKNFVLKGYMIMGQSLSRYVSTGALVEYRDSANGAWNYKAQKQINLWGEIIVTKSKMIQPAVFVGYIKNLGLNNELTTDQYKVGSYGLYSRGITTSRTFDHILRIAPRVDIISNKFKFSPEIELMTMLYGNTDKTNLKIVSTGANEVKASNIRVQFTTSYTF